MITYSYANLDLEIRRERAGYVALIRSPEAVEHAFGELPFSESELARFPLAAGLTRNLRPAPAAAPAEPLTPEVFGRRLFQAVFDGDVRDCLVRQLERVEQHNQAAGDQRRGLRIRLHLSDVPELATLPWEYLCRSRGDFLALSLITPLVRILPHTYGAATTRVTPPLTVLVITANPGGGLNVNQEWRDLAEAFAAPQAVQRVRLTFLPRASLELLREELRERRYHVIHVIGHGSFDAQAQEGVIQLDEPVSATTLGVHLHDHRPRLVFLNACESGAASATDLLAGTAQRLIASGVETVVAMQSPISDRAALALAREFYRAIADGYPVDAALAQGRQALFATRQQPEWGIPVLFSVADDLMLLQPPGPPPPPPIPRQPFEPELVTIPAGPFQMGSPDPADIAQGDWEIQQVTLPAYAIGKYPVTNAQYAAFVKEHHDRRPQGFGWSFIQPPRQKEAQPVVGVTYEDACAYCRWLSQKTGRTYRLPTDAEWQQATRHGAVAGAIYEWTSTRWDAANPPSGEVRPADLAPQAEDADPDALRVCRGGPAPAGGGPPDHGCYRFAPHARHPALGFRVAAEHG